VHRAKKRKIFIRLKDKIKKENTEKELEHRFTLMELIRAIKKKEFHH